MMEQATVAERILFGRPLEAARDPAIHLVPRPMTALLARTAMAAIFVVSGSAKLVDVAGTAEHMTRVGIPYPETLAMLVGIAEILGAVALIFGALTRAGALGLLIFLIPTTLIFHNFWASSPAEYQMQQINFMKNFTIMGGMLMVWAFGPGRIAMDKT